MAFHLFHRASNLRRELAAADSHHDGNENALKVDDLGPYVGVYLLVHRDDPKHGGRSLTVCAPERRVRREWEGEQRLARREVRDMQQPGMQEHAAQVSRQKGRVEDCRRDSAPLFDGDLYALRTFFMLLAPNLKPACVSSQ